MLRGLVRLYGEINNGDYEKGVRDFADQVEEESKNFIAEMIDDPIALGVSMSSVMSKAIEDIAFMTTLIFWAIMGKDYKEVWSEPELEILDDGIIIFRMQQKQCLFCAGETLLPSKFGECHTGEVFAAIVKGIMQALQDYVGNNYEVRARETKCFMRGDPYGEITLWLNPK